MQISRLVARRASLARGFVSLTAALLVGACASGDLHPRDGAGDTDRGTERDTGPGDTADDTGAGRDTSTGRDLGTDDIAPSDTGGGTDTSSAPDWAVRWENAATVNPKVGAASGASYDALVAWCQCCDAEFGSDPAVCFAGAFEGGMRVDACEAGMFDTLGAQADGWLTCMSGAWATLAGCDACGASGCSLCANNFAFDAGTCGTSYPNVPAAMASCAE